jgi:ribonuclease BN (tRNA processing enzyme)
VSTASEPSGPLELTVIGSAAAWSSDPARPSSCYLVELGSAAILLDLGQGAFAALSQRRQPESVAAVIVSHAHPDHHVDLVALRHYVAFARGGSLPRDVSLHAPRGLRARYDAFLGEPGFLDLLAGSDLVPGEREIGAFGIEARNVTHIDEAFALRLHALGGIPGAPALVYSGDCGRWQDLVPLIREGDTLLCEAFWGAGKAEAPSMHLRAAEAALAAREGGAARLVLTHLSDEADRAAVQAEARAHFAGDVVLAEPGLVLSIR